MRLPILVRRALHGVPGMTLAGTKAWALMTTSECPHGEPRGPVYCAFCRRAGTEGKPSGPDGPTWERRAYHALIELAAEGHAFTSEDLTARAGFPNQHLQNANNRVGLLIQRHAARLNLRRVRFERAKDPRSNGRQISVWMVKS